MSARRPANNVVRCKSCNAPQRNPVLVRVTSRVFVDWECEECGTIYRTDAASGKYIGVSPFNKVHDE